MTRQMLLNAFHMNCVGHQSSGLWRHPRDRSDEYTSLRYWQELARTLERGLFDGVFLADVTGVYDVYAGTPDAALRSAAQVPANDPFALVPAMAAVTEHLGFGVTGSIPYEPPYAFARRISSLDHLTGGRMGWNVVTGYLDSAARGIGSEQQVDHDSRYDIADEYMELVYRLWEESWEDDAVLRDPARGIFTDPAKVHRITHRGRYFNVDAIHLCEPSPQRTPVIFQAGASSRGRAFAARHAECVFTGGNPEALSRYVRHLRANAVEHGRSPDHVKVFAMLAVVVDETDAAARAKLEDYRRYGLIEGALALMSGWSGVDLSPYGLDERADAITTEAIQVAMQSVGSRTVREWAEFLVVGGAAPIVTGSPRTVVDTMERLMQDTDIDGFNLAYTVMPECVTDFVTLVVPELQRRGLYKTAYRPGTFRDKLFARGPRLAEPHPATAGRRRRQLLCDAGS